MAESSRSREDSLESKKMTSPKEAEPPDRQAKYVGKIQKAKSTEFLFETKYVMLNFMGLVPPEMYQGHLSTSPESIMDLPLSDHAISQYHKLNKTRSLDTANLHDALRARTNKRLMNVQGLQRSMESPASDDNLSYRYSKHKASFDSAYDKSLNYQSHSDIDSSKVSSSQEDEFRSQSDHALPTFYGKPGNTSPTKVTVSHSKHTCSDVSSPDDFSYVSDADDELEDNSNASSIFSSRSGGYLDLRKSVPRLSTLASQSENLDDVDGIVHGVIAEVKDSEDEADSLDDLESKNENLDDAAAEGLDEPDHAVGARRPLVSRRPVADRSKLKLNIPSQPIELDDVLVSLHTELNSELSELETEYEEVLRNSFSDVGVSPHLPPLTPQTEAAKILARIGDGVRDEYGSQITNAANSLLMNWRRETTYEQFKQMSSSVIETNLPGWRQVALLMVYSQKIMWNAVQQGQKQCSSIVDYSTQLVADVAAEFIIKEGGWGAVMNFDPSQSSDTQSSVECDPSPEHGNYFVNTHDVTQVESETFQNGSADGHQLVARGVASRGDARDSVKHTNSLKNLSPVHSTVRYAQSEGFDISENLRDSVDWNANQSVDSETLYAASSMIGDSENDFNVRGSNLADRNEGDYNDNHGKNYSQDEDVFEDETKSDVNEVPEIREDSAIEEFGTVETCANQKVNTSTLNAEASGNEDTVDGIIVNVKQAKSGSVVPEDYHKDSVYVKQETPTLNGSFSNITEDTAHSSMPGEIGNGHQLTHHSSETVTQQGGNNIERSLNKGEYQQQGESNVTSKSEEGAESNLEETRDQSVEETKEDSETIEASSAWSPVGHAREFGFRRLAALSIGVLALGASLRLATLNR